MKKLIYLVLVLLSQTVFSQTTPTISVRSDDAFQRQDNYLIALKRLGIPSGPTNTLAATGVTAGNSVKLFFNTTTNTLMVYNPATTTWLPAVEGGGSGGGTFTADVTLNGPAGIRVGKYTNGQTIPVAGLTMQEFLELISIDVVHPNYVAPTASISGSPSPGTYEIGTALSITLTSGFTQNNGGSLNTTTYRKNGVSLGSGVSTDNITSLTTTVNYDVQKTYAQGACINNNIGVSDCVGRIEAGTATSTSIGYVSSPKFFTFRSSASTPNNATILAAAGGTSFLSNSHTGTYTITASGANYPGFAYRSSQGTVSIIKDVNNFDVTSSFNTGTLSFTNAQGYVETFRYYILNSTTAANYTITIL